MLHGRVTRPSAFLSRFNLLVRELKECALKAGSSMNAENACICCEQNSHGFGDDFSWISFVWEDDFKGLRIGPLYIGYPKLRLELLAWDRRFGIDLDGDFRTPASEFADRTRRCHFTVIENHTVRTDLLNLGEVVTRNEHCSPRRLRGDEVLDAPAVVGVEPRGRFVEEQYIWGSHEGLS